MPIYRKFDSAFKSTSAWALVDDATNQQIGLIAVKHTTSGVVHAYVHEFGETMVHGKAGGYGYDKLTAALRSIKTEWESRLYEIIKNSPDNGEWQAHLKDNGITVMRAI